MRKQHQAIELKWHIWLFCAVLLLPAMLWTYNGLNEAFWNRQYIKLGKSVDCRTRPTPNYLKYCNPASDGVSCMDESRTRLIDWHASIDYACAQYEPDRTFVFRVHDTPPEHEIAAID